MHYLKLFLFVCLVSASSVAAAEEFTAYEGKNAIREGEGGAKKTVNGTDCWTDGAPPYPFKILGFINDKRLKSGLFGALRMSSLESDVAALAKANGGDAVITSASESETVGTVGSGNSTATGTANSYNGTTTARASGMSTWNSVAVQKQNSKFVVIKYMKDSQPPSTTQATPTPAPISQNETATEPSRTQ